MRTTTLIVDDEPLARRGIRQLLEAHPRFQVVGESRNGREAVRSVRALQPELVFLDIQMPGMDGFEVVREIGPDGMPEVVFVTAFDEYAVRAFETHALDYLVKPVSQARFDATIARVSARLRDRDAVATALRLRQFLEGRSDPPATSEARETITVPTAGGFVIVPADEIDWIEADDYYAAIYARGKRLLIRESLASFEARLDRRRFVRVHRSAIVAMDRIRELRPGRGGVGKFVVVLRDGTRVPVSRRRREEVVGVLKEKVESGK
jgi:two-component system LytT family response regulator